QRLERVLVLELGDEQLQEGIEIVGYGLARGAQARPGTRSVGNAVDHDLNPHTQRLTASSRAYPRIYGSRSALIDGVEASVPAFVATLVRQGDFSGSSRASSPCCRSENSSSVLAESRPASARARSRVRWSRWSRSRVSERSTARRATTLPEASTSMRTSIRPSSGGLRRISKRLVPFWTWRAI